MRSVGLGASSVLVQDDLKVIGNCHRLERGNSGATGIAYRNPNL